MTSLQSAFSEFILSCEADGLSRATIVWYRSLIGAFVQGRESAALDSFSAHDLREYLSGLRAGELTEDTLSAHNRALHKFWSWAAKEYSSHDPMHTIRYPKKPQPHPHAAALDDIARIFRVAGPRDRAMLALLLDTGCRAGGLVTLRLDDVDLENHRAIVTEKGNISRAVVFTDFTAGLVRQWVSIRVPAPTLFYNLDTLQPLTVNGLRHMLRRLAARAGVDGKVNPHAFRHSFAREYLKAGGDLATLSKLMGHRDVSTTVNHYTLFTDDEIADKHEKYSPVKALAK